MTREEAYKILETHEGANREEIETRYTMLTRRYRHDDSDEAQEKIAQIVEAYDLLSGKKQERENVDPKDLEKVLGKEKREWRNIWDYGRKPLVFILIGVALVVSLVYSIVTNEMPDYKVTFLGAFGDVRDQMPVKWEDYLVENGIGDNPFVEVLPLYEGMDPQTQSAIMMKAVLVVSGTDGTDLLVLDRPSFERYGAQGALDYLEDLYHSLEDAVPEEMDKYVKPAMNAMKEPPDDDPTGEPIPVEDEQIYGLDVSEHTLLQGLGVLGQEEILAIPVRSEHKEATAKLIQTLLENADQLDAWLNEAIENAQAERQGQSSEPTESTNETAETSEMDDSAETTIEVTDPQVISN